MATHQMQKDLQENKAQTQLILNTLMTRLPPPPPTPVGNELICHDQFPSEPPYLTDNPDTSDKVNMQVEKKLKTQDDTNDNDAPRQETKKTTDV